MSSALKGFCSTVLLFSTCSVALAAAPYFQFAAAWIPVSKLEAVREENAVTLTGTIASTYGPNSGIFLRINEYAQVDGDLAVIYNAVDKTPGSNGQLISDYNQWQRNPNFLDMLPYLMAARPGSTFKITCYGPYQLKTAECLLSNLSQHP